MVLRVMPGLMNEFDLIAKFFAPLAQKAPGADQLSDDAAVIEGDAYVVTKDMLIAGVHFLPKDPLDLVARKLIRVNLSDLAAKGAKPVGYFLACAWPTSIKPTDIALFADGLREDQGLFDIALFGGDTTSHRTKAGPLTLSATFFGRPPRGGVVRRRGAEAGDDLYVTGTIGDAGLGLAALKKNFRFTKVDHAALAGRYHLPEPRLSMGAAIAGLASATIDVSDGLLADAEKLAGVNGLRAEIDAVSIPRSAAAGTWVAAQENRWKALATLAAFGDDYEILFTAPASMRRSVTVAAKASRTPVARIGSMKKGGGAALLDEAGRVISAPSAGYDHFED